MKNYVSGILSRPIPNEKNRYNGLSTSNFQIHQKIIKMFEKDTILTAKIIADRLEHISGTLSTPIHSATNRKF